MVPSVLFINPWDRLIGPNRYLAEMLRSAPELATRSTVVFHESSDAMEEYRSMGCRVAVWPEVKLLHPHVTASNLGHFIRTHSLGLAKVVQGLRTFRPDVVVTNTEIVTVGGIAARILGIPHLQVFHSLLFKYRKERVVSIVRLYARWLSFFASRFIAVSETVKQMLAEYGVDSDKVTVVHNGFDIQDVRGKSKLPLPADVQNLICGRYPVLVSVGRIAPMKGQDILIEAMNSLRVSYPLSRCLIVGRVGSEDSVEDVMGFSQHLMRRIEACQLQDYIHFIGEIDYVPSLLAHSDLYIHPSLTESFSRVVAEAVICGKPVVCTNAGALPEVLGSQGAVFVEPGNAEALGQGVLRVLGEEAIRQDMVSFGRAYVESHYPVYRTTEKLLNVLKAVVGNNVVPTGVKLPVKR
jgi:glycosyltransferase involved in cell wall biosynthesis